MFQEEYPSGFLFINDVFYNDFRNENAIDYSKVIRDWAEKKRIGKFTTGDINTVSITSVKECPQYNEHMLSETGNSHITFRVPLCIPTSRRLRTHNYIFRHTIYQC